ncbi:hypothetical protein HRJ45_01490 [Vibrio coralliilyticus]|uniref:hypothetical protein n=1 Tax=Vibrio coralliilyticus TaxID=190893 RepID=UPI00156017C2|nr:hypothetical protein [Vibrio coralliilyticus]NRF23526.1 hypothetical protein [Vibrio coralliilyticus]NRF77763.1 hypothetical protein [Vibrio coralliilyticus]
MVGRHYRLQPFHHNFCSGIKRVKDLDTVQQTSPHQFSEGAENAEQSAYLLSRNVHQQQGFLFAKPMPYEQLTDWRNQYEHSS